MKISPSLYKENIPSVRSLGQSKLMITSGLIRIYFNLFFAVALKLCTFPVVMLKPHFRILSSAWRERESRSSDAIKNRTFAFFGALNLSLFVVISCCSGKQHNISKKATTIQTHISRAFKVRRGETKPGNSLQMDAKSL